MLTDIPGGPLAPEISIAGSSFSITEGDEFTAAYEVTGTEPITVTVKATRADGSAAAGFSADQNARKINAPSNLAPGTYRVTVTAKNADGEDSASFTLTVSAKPVIGTAPGSPSVAAASNLLRVRNSVRNTNFPVPNRSRLR
jgi:PKD repeat protein